MPKKGIPIEIGQRFGRLEVIEEIKRESGDYGRRFLCRCDCGTEKVVLRDSLVRGATKSCGCLSRDKAKERRRVKIEAGQRFGRLSVIEEIKRESGDYRARALCRCDCGTEKVILYDHLVRGNVLSCGCLAEEKLRERHDKTADKLETEYVGKKFGRLTVIERANNTKRGTMAFVCDCDCGNRVTLPQNALQTGQKSCGCIKKEIFEIFCEKRDEDCKEGTKLGALTAKLSSANKSGYKGVHWSTQMQKWKAVIGFKGKKIVLGFYKNVEDAAKARKKAEEKYYEPILEKYGKKLH